MRSALLKTVIVLSQSVFGVSPAFAAPAKIDNPIEYSYKSLSGKGTLRALAMTCSEKSWLKVRDWAQASGFDRWTSDEEIKISVNSQSFRFTLPSGESGEVKRSSETKLALDFGGKTYSESDACEIVSRFTAQDKASALRSLLIDEAQAERVKQGRAWERFGQVFGIATGAFLLFGSWPVIETPLGWGMLAASALSFQVATKDTVRIRKIDDFEQVLNSNFDLVCNKSYTSIKNGLNEIVVRKVPAYTVEFAANHQILHSNSDSFVAREARRMALKIASTCNSKEEADKIMDDYGVTVKGIKAKLASLENSPPGEKKDAAPH